MTKKSEFDKVLSSKDILVIAFGAMIGWGWVISTGDWIHRGGFFSIGKREYEAFFRQNNAVIVD